MRRDKAQPLVEPVGILALLVGGELHEATAAGARHRDHCFHHLLADPLAAMLAANADRFDLGAPAAAARQSRDVGQLQTSGDLAVLVPDQKQIVRIRSDCIERSEIGGHVAQGILACAAQWIIGQKLDDGGNFLAPCVPQRHHAISERNERRAEAVAPASSSQRKCPELTGIPLTFVAHLFQVSSGVAAAWATPASPHNAASGW